MKIKSLFVIVVLSLFWALTSCQDNLPTKDAPVTERDTLTALQHVQERGKLVAVTNCEIINYNTENATPSGFEYELLSDFCKANGLELEMRVNENLDSCFMLLDSCQVDIVAVGIGANPVLCRRFAVNSFASLQSNRCWSDFFCFLFTWL